MIEINTPKINIDEIKARIEEEVQQYRKANPLIGEADIDAAPEITKDYLLQFHGQDFINRAYGAILHREPDPQGGAVYLEKLMRCELTKVYILGKLRYSREGRSKKVEIKGLLLPYILQTFFKIPLLGWGARVATGVLNLPTVLKNIQRIESELVARNCSMEEKNRSHVLELKENIQNLGKEIIRERASGRTEMEEKLSAIRTELSDKLSGELSATRTELSDNFSGELSSVRTELSTTRTELLKQIKDHKITLLDTQRRLQLLLEEARKRLPQPISNLQLENMVKEEDHIFDALYLSFEDRFRGTEKDIKERVSVYLPYVKKICKASNTGALLDVGCGRGEWLSLLKENNIPATGLDLNSVMVGKCRDADLTVEQSDVIAYLSAQKPNTLSVITGFHIVEHLPFKTMIALFDESLRVLRPGGMIIFETPNPENIMVGACNFYTDPTHKNPIPPHTLAYLIEARGFVSPEILRLHPLDSVQIQDPFLNHYFTVGQDYSVIGFKA